LSYVDIILIGFSIGTFLYLFELAWIWGGLAGFKSNVIPDINTSISLIIAARDEERNLKQNLELWLGQNHNSFEVIVVDDCSYDNTQFLLNELQRKFQHLHVVNLDETNIFKGGKKHALSLGIKAAQFDRVLFTDADCKPSSKDWLALMNAQFTDQKEIVLGMGIYEKKKGILNYLIRVDAIQIAIQYLGTAARGFPYMGVGRNLAYKKQLYFEVGGFKKHIDLKWGDDDLFINQIAQSDNTTICALPDAQTISKSKTSFREWFTQKRRHMSTSGRYRFGTKMLISIKSVRMLLYYSTLIYGLFIPELFNSFLISASIIYLVNVLMFLLLKNKIGKVDEFYVFPFAEIALFVVNILLYLTIWIRKPKSWN
jgi:glycosyltransferase involved in cell wall biosynthesis